MQLCLLLSQLKEEWEADLGSCHFGKVFSEEFREPKSLTEVHVAGIGASLKNIINVLSSYLL